MEKKKNPTLLQALLPARTIKLKNWCMQRALIYYLCQLSFSSAFPRNTY